MQKISALGLDLGSKRIGVAGCDGTGLIATGITTIERTSFQQDIAQLRELIEQRQVQVLVVGLPYSMDGTIGPQATKIQKLALKLAAALDLPVEYEDERLSSWEAEELTKTKKRSLSTDKGLIDRKAAALILQRWLDSRRWLSQRNTPPAENFSPH
ncbi:Holliday junction resolvase RuvX [Lyngbya aestuarii]|uniref:Holliday junction resolvase RuvX n=1 Tax=Lyngbya aestuarii TaxID=118322 RepID=UPI00403D670C